MKRLSVGLLISAVVLVVLSAFVAMPGDVLKVGLLVMFFLWLASFAGHESFGWADVPYLLLVMGTVAMGRSFSIMGIHVGGVPLYVTEAMMAASVGLLLLKGKELLRKLDESLPVGLLPVLLSYFLLGSIHLVIGVKGNGGVALRDIVFCHYMVLLFIAMAFHVRGAEIQRFLKYILPAVAVLLASALVLFFFFVPGSHAFRQVVKEMKMTNLGLYAGFIVIFGMSFFTYARNRNKILVGVAVYLGLFFVVMAEVRAAWLGLLIALILLGILLRKHFRAFALIFLMVVVTVVVVDYFELGVQKRKLASIKEQVGSVSHKGKRSMPAANIKWRLGIWEQTWEEIKESPVFGWGYGIQIDYVIWKKRLSHLKAIGASSGVVPPHNHLLAITYKLGFLGLLIFLFINARVFFYGLSYVKKCRTDYHRRFLIASLGCLIHWHGMAFFFDVLESPPTSIFLWILLGMILSVVYVDRTYSFGNSHESY